MIYVILYFALASFSMFMRGYADPEEASQTPFWLDWLAFFIWPFSFPSLVMAFGGSLRVGYGK